MRDELPVDIAEGATIQGNEYGWNISSFPGALEKAQQKGYACLGGQFQFRLEDGSAYEMYWLNADSTERREGESWADYVHRSCSEVLKNFQQVISKAAFAKEAQSLKLKIDSSQHLVFVGYFVTENDLLRNSPR